MYELLILPLTFLNSNVTVDCKIKKVAEIVKNKQFKIGERIVC